MVSARGVVAACIAIVPVDATVAQDVTPLQKVQNLLADLKDQVEAEGAIEAKSYAKFAHFCQETTELKSDGITYGQDKIDKCSATMEELTAKKNAKGSEVLKRKGEQETMTVKLKEEEVRCEKEKAEYEVNAADLTKAIAGLEGAAKSIGGSKGASFLALRPSASLDSIFDLADSLNLMSSPKRQASVAFLQGKASVDPDDPEYKFHSDGIMETITGLLDDFNKAKTELDAEWGKTKDACDTKKQALNDDMTENKKAIDQCEEDIEQMSADFADAKESLLGATAVLKDDQAYLKDLTKMCEERARDWDQRSQQRAGEIEAISQALTILTGAEGKASARALVQVHRHLGQPVSFIQRSGKKASEGAAGVAREAVPELRRVADLLQVEGQRLHSSLLTSAASHASADPFGKVKDLIQKLIERLVAEATSEATKKGFCDTELAKARKDLDYRTADEKKLNVTLEVLNSKADELTAEIDELTIDLGNLRMALELQSMQREEERKENRKSIKDGSDGLAAVQDAIAVLKKFYGQASKADKYHSGELDKASFLQASPVDEDTSGPGFKGAYKGNQAASSGILGLLAVIESDFKHQVDTTTAAEKEAQAAHVKFERTSKADIAGKETKKTLDEADLKTTENNIVRANEDLKTAMDLAQAARDTIEDLRPTCIDTGMSYEERVKKREQEIEALKNALTILAPPAMI